jgi:translation initiation factor IF-2
LSFFNLQYLRKFKNAADEERERALEKARRELEEKMRLEAENAKRLQSEKLAAVEAKRKAANKLKELREKEEAERKCEVVELRIMAKEDNSSQLHEAFQRR